MLYFSLLCLKAPNGKGKGVCKDKAEIKYILTFSSHSLTSSPASLLSLPYFLPPLFPKLHHSFVHLINYNSSEEKKEKRKIKLNMFGYFLLSTMHGTLHALNYFKPCIIWVSFERQISNKGQPWGNFKQGNKLVETWSDCIWSKPSLDFFFLFWKKEAFC